MESVPVAETPVPKATTPTLRLRREGRDGGERGNEAMRL